MKIGHFAFLSPLWGLMGNILWSSLAHFVPVSVNWTCLTRCYGWGAMSEYRLKISDFAPTGPGWPKTSGRRGRPPTILLLKKLSDRQTEFSSLDRVCIPCNSVKKLRNGRCLGWNSIMLCFRHMSTKPRGRVHF